MIKNKKGFIQHFISAKFDRSKVTSKKSAGFTLIELLVVIAIIALLTTLAVTALDSARRKSRDSKRVTDVKQFQTALELYFNDEEGYPNGSFTLGEGTSCSGAACDCLASGGFSDNCDAAESLYMGLIPANIQPGGISYVYTCRADTADPDPLQWTVCGGADQGVAYTVEFNLEGGVENIGSGNHLLIPSGIR
jgi:prepilin-type N-terminal cleavage/methylation domain-containing protein